MSCQQASRFITTTSDANVSSISITHSNASNNSTKIVNAEDPYVFTESVPTTPPILFNTQKSRSRLSDIVSVPTSISFGNVPQQRVSLTNGTIAEITSQANASTKNVITQSLTTTAGTTQNKKATNVCIVRPQLQQQQQQQQHVISSTPCLERELKSISPPPLYTHTPSLWQTPLLIESAPTKPTPTPATSIAPLPPTPTLGATLGGNVSALPLGGCSSSSSPALSSTTAMAKVAPIVVHSITPLSPPASCLPPSKFHSHTMAQHLQKVECLKKPKKSVQPLSQFCTDDLERSESVVKTFVESLDKTSVESLDNEQTLKSVKNSTNAAENDIPVNVIFRMALVPQSHQPQMDINHTNSKNETFLTPAVKNYSTVSSPSPSLSLPYQQAKSNDNTDASVTTTAPPASKTNHIARTQEEINPSSMQQHSQHQQIHCNSNQYETPVQQCMPQEEDQSAAAQPLRKTKVTNSKPRKPSNTKSILNHFEPANRSTLDCSTPKGSVAIVKMSHRITEASERDISHLATPAGLPYCLQNHWFTSYDIRNRLVAGEKGKLNRSLLREERINLYKQQLRRQAIQLLSTRSLQRLPLHLARKRLVCVDRLFRKYNKQSKIGLPANLKRCIVRDCKAASLEMASYCQQHIALNTGQAIFLECTAKFSDNTQCRVPVFDIRHDLPLCLEHARKRDAYNRLSCEPKPRKNLASNGPVVASVSYCGTMGKAIRAKQPCMPAGNKRVTSGNPQAPPGRKRKTTGNPVGRPLKRAKKCPEGNVASIVPCLTSAGLKRKNSTTSLESLTSNSQHSSTSSTSHFTHQKQFNSIAATSIRPTTNTTGINSLSPPALAPLSTGFMHGHSLPRHLFSFGNDNNNINANVRKHSTATPNFSHTTELKDFASNLTSASHKTSQPSSFGTHANIESTDANFINTNSNSNFTSSGMGSTTSIPSADDFLTQDMLSICENSSASSVDTGLGGLSDPEFMLGTHDGDDIPLGDTHLLEEQDLASVLSSLPEDAFKELFSAVHPDESDEIERAIELADKHLKTLQQTIGTNDLLGDFLNFSDDMLLDQGDICSSAGTAPSNQMIDTSSLYLAGGAVTNISANGN